jgi:hypothetical protein
MFLLSIAALEEATPIVGRRTMPLSREGVQKNG